MAKLTTAKRKSLPGKSFAEPGEHKYPIEDKAHARNALSRVAQFGSAAEKKKVKAAVKKKYPGIGGGTSAKKSSAKKSGAKKSSAKKLSAKKSAKK